MAQAQAHINNKGVAQQMLEALIREYGEDRVTVIDEHVARVRVPWSYTPPSGEKIAGEVDVTLPLTLEGNASLVGDKTYSEAQVLAFFRRGAVLAVTQAARQAAQRGTTAQDSLRRQLERLAEKARALVKRVAPMR